MPVIITSAFTIYHLKNTVMTCIFVKILRELCAPHSERLIHGI